MYSLDTYTSNAKSNLLSFPMQNLTQIETKDDCKRWNLRDLLQLNL